MQRGYRVLQVCMFIGSLWPVMTFAAAGDEATHESDHEEDVLELPEVHVHGLPLNKDQQRGPVPKVTPWPAVPPALDGKELDDWMKVRMLVSKGATVTVVVLEPAKHRELTIAGMAALKQWTFDPQLKDDEPIGRRSHDATVRNSTSLRVNLPRRRCRGVLLGGPNFRRCD